MGYRSEVVIVVPRDSKQAILDIIPLEDWNKVNDNDHDDYGNNIKTTLFYMSDTKWYPRVMFEDTIVVNGYDEVNKIMSYLETIDETEGKSKYAFLRSGENYDDLEELGDPYKYGIFVNKSIDF